MNTYKVARRNLSEKAKRLRREGFVTGSLYGRALEGAISLKFEEKVAEKLHRECLKGSQLMLELEGQTYDVLLKEADYDARSHQILELDFQALVKGEKVHATTEIVLKNRDGVKEGVVEQVLAEVAYKALPEDILNEIEIDCAGLKLGDTVRVADLAMAGNPKLELITHPETLIVSVAPTHYVAPEETEAAPATPAEKAAAETSAKNASSAK